MDHAITALDALEILDSRGNPTLQVRLTLSNGLGATASVPSGASTSQFEARELRNGDASRFAGRGVRKAIDTETFRKQNEIMGKRITIVGDDLYATNPKIIRRGIAEHATNAALSKLNQIGTVSETIALCRAAGWRYMVSHRSGETTGPLIADFTVAMDGGLLKAGSLSHGERLVKYNRLIEIEQELGTSARFRDIFAHNHGARSIKQ